MSAGSAAASLLQRQLKDIQTSKDLQGVSCGLVSDDNLFEWEVMLMINDDCKYYGDGVLCISILHPPEEDSTGYELAAERWSPVQSPETILVSTISLFHDPNTESPANVEAAVLLREEREGKHKEFRKRCRRCVRESLGED
ncbi:hypothetical protein ACO1O0_004248 [Amphichorda felina]